MKRKVVWGTAGPSLGRKKSEKRGQEERKAWTWCDGKVSKSRKLTINRQKKAEPPAPVEPSPRLHPNRWREHVWCRAECVLVLSHGSTAKAEHHPTPPPTHMQASWRQGHGSWAHRNMSIAQRVCFLRKRHTPTPWETRRREKKQDTITFYSEDTESGYGGSSWQFSFLRIFCFASLTPLYCVEALKAFKCLFFQTDPSLPQHKQTDPARSDPSSRHAQTAGYTSQWEAFASSRVLNYYLLPVKTGTLCPHVGPDVSQQSQGIGAGWF